MEVDAGEAGTVWRCNASGVERERETEPLKDGLASKEGAGKRARGIACTHRSQ